MGGVLARQVGSFESGAGGTAHTDAGLTPRVRRVPLREVATDPAQVLAAPTLAVPELAVATDPLPLAASTLTLVVTASASYAVQRARQVGARPPTWLQAIGRVLLGVLIGVVTLAAVAAVVYAVGAALAAAGVIAGVTVGAAVLIAAAILVVSFFVVEVWNRVQEYRAVFHELTPLALAQIVGVSLLSIIGVTQIYEARAGRHALTGLALGEVERWESGIGGVVQFGLSLLGVRALGRWLRGRTPGAPVPSGEVPGGAPGASRAPGSTGEGGPGAAAGSERPGAPPSRIYRVQGGTPPRASRVRIQVGPRGEMQVVGDDMLFVTFDDVGRARAYVVNNRPGAEIISFEIDPVFVEQVRRAAVPQAQARAFPDAPQIADPTRTSSSYGLPLVIP